MAQFDFYLVSAAITFAIQLSGFSVAFALQTETFYDILGGVNYVALVAWSALQAPSLLSDPHKCAASVLFVISRAWLLLFLAWRAHDRKGDARFDGVKDKFGQFLLFWMVQGMWVFLISMPMLFINSSTVSRTYLSALDWMALLGFALGIVIEVVADLQKTIWVKEGRVGGFCKMGIWSYSRHPNYFGEILQWWCAWALAYSSGNGFADPWWLACAVSPVFTMHVLLNIPATGVWNAEGKNLKRYYDKCPEEYSKYRNRTSVLVPMVGYDCIPLFLKRTLFFDLQRYEYRQQKGSSAEKTH